MGYIFIKNKEIPALKDVSCEFTCTKKDASTNEWIIRNSLGNFAQNGQPGNVLEEINIIPPYAKTSIMY